MSTLTSRPHVTTVALQHAFSLHWKQEPTERITGILAEVEGVAIFEVCLAMDMLRHLVIFIFVLESRRLEIHSNADIRGRR